MNDNIERLVAVGFKEVGGWTLKDNKLSYNVEPHSRNKQDVLYAFVVGDCVKYVGKSAACLSSRLNQHRNSGKTRTYLLESLRAHESVKIYLLISPQKQKLGEFNISVPAGLEDSIIEKLAPKWNVVGTCRSNVIVDEAWYCERYENT